MIASHCHHLGLILPHCEQRCATKHADERLYSAEARGGKFLHRRC